MTESIKIAVSLLPVFVFLIALIFLDSYKLVRPKSILFMLIVGVLAAAASLFVNTWIQSLGVLDARSLSRYASPVVEEVLKAIFVIYLIRANKVGFIVDAAIAGFAVGAGFSLVENIYYLSTLPNGSILLWLLRGFGTAALHGATTSIFGIISKGLTERRPSRSYFNYFPGFGVVIVIHSVFNHFIIPPVWTTVILLLAMPPLLIFAFDRSEKATKSWLGAGMDADMQLLDSIVTGQISATPIGAYLSAIKEKFPAPVVVDMLCLLRIHAELSIGAKAILLMRECGIKPPPNPTVREQLDELRFLEKSLGTTGKLAISPFLKSSSRDLWQLYMVKNA
jgi:RsiW-degrading membrane proteinase PrsW (M82 family)